MDCAALAGGVNRFARCGFYLNPHRPFSFFLGQPNVLSWVFHGRRSFVGIGNLDYERYW